VFRKPHSYLLLRFVARLPWSFYRNAMKFLRLRCAAKAFDGAFEG
jgi:hypothetical protein